MHELALAQEVLRRVETHAARVGAARVLEVTLRIGRLNLVVPDALTFYFDVCKEETIAAGARLLVEDLPGRAYCRSCAREYELDHPLAVCPARHAGIEWRSGFELAITRMRIQDAEERPCVERVAAANRKPT